MIQNDEIAEQVCRLTVKGCLDREQAVLLRDELLQALSKAKRVEVNLGEAEDMDLSCLQLLCAAHLNAVRHGKQLIVQNAQEKILQILSMTGLANHPLFAGETSPLSETSPSHPPKDGGSAEHP